MWNLFGGDNSTCSDCAGVPNGSSYEDECGTCDDDSSNDCVQDCAGEWGGTALEDECGVCNGEGPSEECWDGSFVCYESDCPPPNTDSNYIVNLPETGQSQLTLLNSSISSLQVGDEIGIFDSNGITNYNDCSNQLERF